MEKLISIFAVGGIAIVEIVIWFITLMIICNGEPDKNVAKTKDLEPRAIEARIIVKGKCPVCGKKLGEDDNIFICQECLKKDLEYRKERGK